MPKTTVLLHRADIARRVEEMGRQLTTELEAERAALLARGDKTAHEPIVMVPILTGAMLFVADLIRQGRDLEKIVLARAVGWHVQHRVLPFKNKTVVFA